MITFTFLDHAIISFVIRTDFLDHETISYEIIKITRSILGYEEISRVHGV